MLEITLDHIFAVFRDPFPAAPDWGAFELRKKAYPSSSFDFSLIFFDPRAVTSGHAQCLYWMPPNFFEHVLEHIGASHLIGRGSIVDHQEVALRQLVLD